MHVSNGGRVQEHSVLAEDKIVATDQRDVNAEFIARSRADVPWLIEMVETYRRALQEIATEYVIGVDQVLEETNKPGSEYSDLRVAQIRGMSLERISDVILDLEDDSLFDLPEE